MLAELFKQSAESFLDFVVTTSNSPSPGQTERAKNIAVYFEVPFAERRDLSFKDLARISCAKGLLVLSLNRLTFIMGDHEFFFHPGLARLRIKGVRNGAADQMIGAMSLRAGDSVLDCTMGLGTDAIVASYAAGAAGRVTGLESSAIIAELVKRGLSAYQDDDQDIKLAMRRINVINKNNKEYLASLEAGSYDIVYLDPMFRFPRLMSSAINTARMLANHDPVDCETVELAINVAARRVVMKERRGSAEFDRLGFKHIIGGRHAPVSYGVIER